MSSWEARWATPSAASQCSVSSRAFLRLALAIFLPASLAAQLTTGTLAGTLRATDGHRLAGESILITGGAGFHFAIRTNSSGEFSITLPYGRYQLSGTGAAVLVSPLQTTVLDLIEDASGAIRLAPMTPVRTPGVWTDDTGARRYPEGLSLAGLLLSREPSSVTEPLDFAGLSDNRLAIESQRGFSWTGTQFKLQGMDASDSYQPGFPAVFPDVQALDEVVVRSAFGQTASSSDGTEVGLFLAEPRASWHGALSTTDTGAAFSWTNLPPPASRGLVQQADQFRWFTGDGAKIGGPLTRWADMYASGSGRWASQAEPLAAPGIDRRSRLLFGNIRGRVRAGASDRFDALYSGSRIDLSDGGMPAGIEALTGNRMAPSFVLPGGFRGQTEVDHLDSVQVGWTHLLPAASASGHNRTALRVLHGAPGYRHSVAGRERGRAIERRGIGIAAVGEPGGAHAPRNRRGMAAGDAAHPGHTPPDRRWRRVENIPAGEPLPRPFRYEPDRGQRRSGVRGGVQYPCRFPRAGAIGIGIFRGPHGTDAPAVARYRRAGRLLARLAAGAIEPARFFRAPEIVRSASRSDRLEQRVAARRPRLADSACPRPGSSRNLLPSLRAVGGKVSRLRKS